MEVQRKAGGAGRSFASGKLRLVTCSADSDRANAIDDRGAGMKKFNNTLAGTDCGDAGLPAHRRDVAKAKPVLRVVARTPEIELKAARATAPNARDRTKSGKAIA
jgi:hypothetical protein